VPGSGRLIWRFIPGPAIELKVVSNSANSRYAEASCGENRRMFSTVRRGSFQNATTVPSGCTCAYDGSGRTVRYPYCPRHRSRSIVVAFIMMTSTAHGCMTCSGASGKKWPDVVIPPNAGAASMTITRCPRRTR